jgi:hypothetical protein
MRRKSITKKSPVFFLFAKATMVMVINLLVFPLSSLEQQNTGDVEAETNMIKPLVRVSYKDPVFGTTITRISDAVQEHLQGLFPQYSKRQVWNSDESKILLFTDDGSARLYDGKKYTYIKTLEEVGGEDVYWHPSDPDIIIFSGDNNLYTYRVSTGQKKLLQSFPGYTFINTRGEGNLSADGNLYAFVGQVYDEKTETVYFRKLVLYNISKKKIISELALPETIDQFDWVSVSPSGKYVVVDYANNDNTRYHGVEVYDSTFRLLWQKGLGAGHSDITRETGGGEFLIMDFYDEQKNITIIKKINLQNGSEKNLLEVSAFFDLHISCRNEMQKDWCLVSTFNYTGRLTVSRQNWLPFENEVFLLKTDGSGQVVRLAHHHSRRYTPGTPDSDNSIYWAEPHASLSRKGNRIIWGSNWNYNVNKVESVDTYVAELR